MTLDEDRECAQAIRELADGPRAESGSCWHPVDGQAEAAEGATPSNIRQWSMWGDFRLRRWVSIGAVWREGAKPRVTHVSPRDAVTIALRMWAAADMGSPFAWWLRGLTLADIHAVFDDVRDRRWFDLTDTDPDDTDKRPREALVYRDEGRGMVVFEVRGRRTEHLARTKPETFHLPYRHPMFPAVVPSAVRGGLYALPDRAPGWVPLPDGLVPSRSPKVARPMREYTYYAHDALARYGTDVVYRGRAPWMVVPPADTWGTEPMDIDLFHGHMMSNHDAPRDAERLRQWWSGLDDAGRETARRHYRFTAVDARLAEVLGHGLLAADAIR